MALSVRYNGAQFTRGGMSNLYDAAHTIFSVRDVVTGRCEGTTRRSVPARQVLVR